MINYEVKEGLAPEDIFFIHGNVASNCWWYPSQAVWEKQAEGKNYKGALIYAEFRGCGKSTAPKDLSEVSMSLFADDFIEVIQSLKRGPMHLVGHSAGGLIAAIMMAKAPELFKKAILLDPVGARGVTFDKSMITAFEAMKVDKKLTATVIGSTIYKNNPEDAFFNEFIVEDAFKAVKAVGHWVLESLDGLDVRDQVKNIKNQTLVLHGEYDVLLPMQDSQEMATLIPGARFVIIPQQGHCVNVENPEKFVAIVRDFLFPQS
jgi:3-oxoadipate enol-lactonase